MMHPGGKMKAITLRDIPGPLARKIEERSKRRGTSLNKTVIEMLEESTSPSKPTVYHDLDDLAGTWTQEEAEEFDRRLQEIRTIDPEMWQ
jgi:hypothetical protein